MMNEGQALIMLIVIAVTFTLLLNSIVQGIIGWKKLRKIISSDLDTQILGKIIDKIFGFLFGFIFNYIIFSTVIYGISNFEFLNNLGNFLLENSFLLQELNTFNNNLLNNIFYNENLNFD